MSYGDFGDATALTRDFRGKFVGEISPISEEGTATAKTHVSEARHGAPDFVTHFRPGPVARRRVVAIQRRADESLRLRLHSCLRQRGSAYRRSLYGTAEAVPFRIGGSTGGLLARRRNAGILPAPASKLAGDPVRFAQNDKRKTEADSLSTPTSKFARRGPWSTGMTSKRQATTEILSLRLRMTSKNEQIRRFWLRQNDDFSGGCARRTSKNRQRQGQRPGLKPVSSMGMGLPRLKPGPISGTKATARANTKADSLRE